MEQLLSQIIEVLKDINNSLNSFGPHWVTIIIAVPTLILLGLYTHYTRRMALTMKETMDENLRPIVSCDLISGKTYYSKQGILPNARQKNDTRCIVKNRSKYNISVFVNLNLKFDGRPVEIADAYAGKKAWPLTSFQEINGHFDVSKGIDLANVNKITIDLQVSYQSDIGKRYENPVQYWHFDREKEIWLNDIGVRA